MMSLMSEGKLHDIRHTLAHLLACAAKEFDPSVRLGIGPVTDDGFYYDFQFSKSPSPDDLKTMEKAMRKLVNKKLPMSGREINKDEGEKLFADQPFKLELMNEYAGEGKVLTAHTVDSFTDLCKGGHVENTGEIVADSFTLTHIAGAYWRGDEKNPMLTRIYGYAFNSKKELDDYTTMLEEAKKRDHRKLGKELGLFAFSDLVGSGLPIFLPKGATLRRELERFITDTEIAWGYQHVYTPDIAKIDLYKTSGHYPYYKDSMYAPIKIDEDEFMLRPMTCPHHFQIYLNEPRSYRDLPMRIAELAKLYRYEASGELSGLVRVRTFCLADAHIICAGKEQAIAEVALALDLIEHIASVFGLARDNDYWYRLSLGDRADDKKYYKNDEAWDAAEEALRDLLRKRGGKFVEAKQEAAFYGPKIDIQMRDVRGKENTAFTVQYDFCMPDRFNLNYHDADGSEKRAIVVHRSSIGAIERVMAFLIEHYSGAFPLWLSPVQVAIIPIGEAHHAFAQELDEILRKSDLRTELHLESESLGKKIREVKIAKIPATLVIGDAEVAASSAMLETRDKGKLGLHTVEKLLGYFAEEIATKR
jgi:threonyl-tRNA synthetase